MYSHITVESSFDSPAFRVLNVYGISQNESGTRDDAKISNNILNPVDERFRTTPMKLSRRIIKKPLIGSFTSARTVTRASAVANLLINARWLCHSPTLPPST